MKDHHHGVNPDDQEILLTFLRSCASAPPGGVYDTLPRDHHYQEAVKKLKESKVWKENVKLRDWLNDTWFPISEVYM